MNERGQSWGSPDLWTRALPWDSGFFWSLWLDLNCLFVPSEKRFWFWGALFSELAIVDGQPQETCELCWIPSSNHDGIRGFAGPIRPLSQINRSLERTEPTIVTRQSRTQRFVLFPRWWSTERQTIGQRMAEIWQIHCQSHATRGKLHLNGILRCYDLRNLSWFVHCTLSLGKICLQGVLKDKKHALTSFVTIDEKSSTNSKFSANDSLIYFLKKLSLSLPLPPLCLEMSGKKVVKNMFGLIF